MGTEMANRRLLGVFAHQDDETFGPGATLAYYQAQGVEVRLLTLTTDVKTRQLEYSEACQIMGVERVEVRPHPFGSLTENPFELLVAEVEDRLRDFRPQAVLTLHPVSLGSHPEHTLVTEVATEAFRRSYPGRPQVDEMPAARLFYFAISETDTQLEEGTEWKAAGVAVDRVTTIVDVRDYISTQTRAAAAYISMGKLGEPWPPEDLAIRQRANEGKDHFVMALSYPAGPPPSAGLFG